MILKDVGKLRCAGSFKDFKAIMLAHPVNFYRPFFDLDFWILESKRFKEVLSTDVS